MQTPIVATLKTNVENKSSKNDSNENPQVTSQQPATIVISVSQSSKKKPTPQQAQHQITLSNAGSTSGSNNGSPRRKFNKMNHNNGPNNSNLNNVQQNGGSASTKHHNRNNKRTNNDNNNNSNTKQMNFKTLNHTKTQIPNVEITQKTTSPIHVVSKSTATSTSAGSSVTTVPAAGKYRSIVKSQQNVTNYEHGDVDGDSSTKSSSPAPTSQASQTSTTEHQLNQQLKTKSSNNPPTSSFNNPINSPLFTVNSGFNSQDQVDVNRKYSIDFLHFVGYKMTNVSLLPPHPHQQQQAISPGKASKHSHDVETNLAALKVALGDNSGYYNNLYPNTYANYTQNQLILQQQQHYQQSFQRNYHHQQQQQQQHQQQQQQHLHNQRIYSNRHDNYRLYNQHPTVIYQTDVEPAQCNCSLNQQQQPPQQPQHQRTYQQNHIHCQQNHQNSYRQVNTKNHHHAHNRDPNRRNRPSYMYNNHQQQPHIHNYNGNYNGNKSRNSLHNTSTSSTSSTKSKTVDNSSPPVERKNLVYIYSSNSSEHHSLSPTPTSSSKSASPTIDKSSVVRSVEVVGDCSYASMDLVDDCDSNSSGSSSTRPLRYEFKQVPTILSAVTYPQASSLSSMTSSSTSTSSTPAIVIPLISSDNDIQKVAKIVEKDLLPAVINDQQNISLWINNSFNLQNAHSVSSDQLNEQNHSKRR